MAVEGEMRFSAIVTAAAELMEQVQGITSFHGITRSARDAAVADQLAVSVVPACLDHDAGSTK